MCIYIYIYVYILEQLDSNGPLQDRRTRNRSQVFCLPWMCVGHRRTTMPSVDKEVKFTVTVPTNEKTIYECHHGKVEQA